LRLPLRATARVAPTVDAMTIRPLTPSDREQWLAMRQTLWPDQSPASHAAEAAAILAQPRRYAVFVSAGEDGRLNGFVEVSLREQAEGCATTPVGYIEGWFVDESARGRGIGRALIAAAEEWARARGCQELASDADIRNQAGQQAHRAVGFEEVERTVHYRKPLGPPIPPSPAPLFPLAVGVDLIAVPRVERALERHGERFLRRVFTPAEVIYSRGRAPELAARFAAKEAVSKALGVGMRILAPDGVEWHEVEVLGDWRGRPEVYLHGRAAERAAQLGLTQWAVSLSHEREYAVAFVVATGG
jgi:phosphopantetheine--protein transferase-like protein